MDRRTFNKLLGGGLVAAAAAPLAPRGLAAAEPIKAGFVYLGPVGDFGWTYQHDVARKEAEDHFGGAVKTVFVENVPEGPDSEHVIADLAAKGCKIIFTTSFGYMNYTLSVAKKYPGGEVRALHRLQARRQRLDLQHPLLRGPLRPGRDRRQAVSKAGVAGYVGSIAVPEVVQGMNAFMLGMKSVNPKAQAEIHPDQFLVRPRQGRRRRQGADRPGLRHHHPAHRFADAAAGGGEPRHSRLRRGDRHGQVRAEVGAVGQRQRLGSLLHQAHPGGARRLVEERGRLGRLRAGMLKMSPFANMPDDVKALAQQTVDDISSGKQKIFVGPLSIRAARPSCPPARRWTTARSPACNGWSRASKAS